MLLKVWRSPPPHLAGWYLCMWLRLVVTERLDIAASIPPSGPTSHSLRPSPVFFKPQVSSNGTKAKLNVNLGPNLVVFVQERKIVRNETVGPKHGNGSGGKKWFFPIMCHSYIRLNNVWVFSYITSAKIGSAFAQHHGQWVKLVLVVFFFNLTGLGLKVQ